MSYISDVLFWISTGLLVPVVLLLIWFFLRALLLLGGFFGQYLSMRKAGAEIRDEFNNLTGDNLLTLGSRLPKSRAVSGYVCSLIGARASKARMNHLLDEYAVYIDKQLEVPNTLVKMGPMLGLMGTLIPMGPALVGLSTGDIASMAYNMQVAFATTVVGLFAAAVGFITKQVRKRWFTEEMNYLEYLAELLDENGSGHEEA